MATNPLVILRQLTGKQKLLYGAGALFGLAILVIAHPGVIAPFPALDQPANL